MQPTIGDGNYILVSKYSAGIRCPQNIFEIPWINIIGYYLLPNKYVNTILHAKKHTKDLKDLTLNVTTSLFSTCLTIYHL